MALKKGVCKNFENCTLADNQEIQEVESSEFRCTECGKPLSEPDSKPPKHFPQWAKIIVAVVALAGLITGGFFLFKSCDSKVRITVISSDETMGTVKGSGKYEFNKLVTIEANANEGYRFVSWDDGNTKNSREILTKGNATYRAIFEKIRNVKITVKPSDSSMGSVSGDGIYDSMSTVSIGAEPKDDCRFVSWDDGNIENPRTFVAKQDVSFTAVFEKNPSPPSPTVTITAIPSDSTMGTVRGGGTYDSMITISIEAIANKGYEFDSWNDGNIENSRNVITGRDETYVAKFKKKSGGGTGTGTGTKQYSFGKYVGELKNGIPEGNGKFYYTRRVQIAKHDTDNPAHYAEAGDWFDGTWGNGDIVSGALYDGNGMIKEKILVSGREWPYDIELEKYK